MTESHAYAAAWAKDDPQGAEFAELRIGDDRMTATGVAIGSDPEPYRLDYALETGAGFVTARVDVETRGRGWRRRLSLERNESGAWSAETEAEGAPELPDPGGDMSAFDGALDPDLGLSPVFNSMPVLRHGLLAGGTAPDLVMVWISVPDLAIHASRQRYAHAGGQLVRFEELDDDFVAEIAFEPSGIVRDYPGIARRIA